jgi:outer membrane usher protein
MILAVEINGTRAAEPVLVRRAGADYLVPLDALRPFRLRVSAADATEVEGVAYVPLARLGIAATLDEASQRLTLTAPAEAFERTSLRFGESAEVPMTRSATGAFLNYDIVGLIGDDVSLSGGVEIGAFSGSGFGTTTVAAQWGGGEASAVRLDSSWTVDDVERLRSIRFGDSVARGGAGGLPVRFAGIQVGRNFAVAPGFVTVPVPTLSASAALPSIVDLYVDGVLAGTRAVPAGPFSVTGLPITAGVGELSAVVRDPQGRESVVTANYYAAPVLFRKGLSDFSYEAGFLRRFYGLRSFSYGDAFAAATHRYGLTDRLTVEGHAEATPSLVQAGAGGDLAVPGVGLFGATVAGSVSGEGTGAQLGLRGERRTDSYAFGGAATFSTAAFAAAGRLDDPFPRASVQLFAGMPVPSGSISASLIYRDSRREGFDVGVLAARGAFRIGGLGSLFLSARQAFVGDGGTAAEIGFSMPLGNGASATLRARTSEGRNELRGAIQKSAPAGEGWGYRADVALGRHNGGSVSATFHGAFGEYGADAAYRDGEGAVRLSAAGSAGLVEGEAFAARRLAQSFAVVDVDGRKNVRVYADNHLVGRTDGKGRLVVPDLRPFEANRLRIELADLPIDTDVTDNGRTVRPYGRSGLAVSFAARSRRGAVIRVETGDGAPLPAGSRVVLNGRGFLSAPGGEVYLEGVEQANRAEVEWPGGRCTVAFTAPPTDEPQPNLGTVRCKVAA